MAVGTPIVYSDLTEKRHFLPLTGISARRDDPASFNECLLQELIDQSPNVLPVREYLPSVKGLFSLAREVPVDLGSQQGFIDNLLITNEGHLVIVETKLYRNPEATRDVITQTLQYGMAVGQMRLMELENRIKRGQNPSLRRDESILECVSRVAADTNVSGLLPEDFEEALERFLRRGEILLLIVSDGIHVGVERVAHWLNDQGSSTPYKLGLIELKFYSIGNDRLVVPRTILKTREISRHVVVVDIRPNADVTASAEVTDEFKTTAGGTVQKSRAVKSAATPLTKAQLLQLIAPENRQLASRLAEELENCGFDQQGTGNYYQYGIRFPSEGGDFHPLAYLAKDGIWVCALKPLRRLIGPEGMIAFHHEANKFAPFYRPDQIDNPESTGSEAKYRLIEEAAIPGLAAFLDGFRTKLTELLFAAETP